MAHRVLHHVDITSVAFLVLPDLLALAGAQANASSVYRRLPGKSGLQDQRIGAERSALALTRGQLCRRHQRQDRSLPSNPSFLTVCSLRYFHPVLGARRVVALVAVLDLLRCASACVYPPHPRVVERPVGCA